MILGMHDTYSTIFLVIEIWLGLLRGCYHVCTHILSMQRKKPLPCKVIPGDFFWFSNKISKPNQSIINVTKPLDYFQHYAMVVMSCDMSTHLDVGCGAHIQVCYFAVRKIYNVCRLVIDWHSLCIFVQKSFFDTFHISLILVCILAETCICVCFFALGASSWTPCEVNPCWSAISSNLIKLNSSSSLQGHLG